MCELTGKPKSFDKVIPWETAAQQQNLYRLSPRPSGRGSRAAIDTQSHSRKRSALNAEMVSCGSCFNRSVKANPAVKDSQRL